MATQVARRLFTVEEYQQIAEAGILGEDERVGLLRGEIVRMAAMGSRHAECVEVLTELLVPALRGIASVRVKLPIVIPEYDEPEPDLGSGPAAWRPPPPRKSTAQ